MAATLAQQNALGGDQVFIARVQSAALAQCLVVDAEVGTTPNHTARLAFANKVVLAPAPAAAYMAALLPCGTQTTQVTIGTAYVSTNPPNSNNVADADILTLVALGWNIWSGA